MARPVSGLGEYLREQRRSAELTLRQLAEKSGLSNPYLSQIENGLRRPSAEVLQQLAKALQISADALYVHAGLVRVPEADGAFEVALASDRTITERQKRVLLDIYHAFRRENLAAEEPAPSADARPSDAAPPSDAATGLSARPEDPPEPTQTPTIHPRPHGEGDGSRPSARLRPPVTTESPDTTQ